MQIFWLASYPKSGNTFVRFLLHNYMFSTVNSSDDVEQRIPDIHNLIPQGKTIDVSRNGSLLVKTHFMYSEEHPYHDSTAGFIYILRNPRDVLLSNSRYRGVTGGQSIDLEQFAMEFIKNMGVKRWADMKMGTWPEHIASWLAAASRIPSIFIRYEDLRLDTAAVLERLLRFLRIEVDKARIQSAVAASSLEAMRNLEASERSRPATSVFGNQGPDNYFVGEGLVNQPLGEISERIEDLYRTRFGSIAGIFGYD